MWDCRVFSFFAAGIITGGLVNAQDAIHAIPFVENKNQWPAGIHYGADFGDAKVFVRDRGLYFVHYEYDAPKTSTQPLAKASEEQHLHSAATALATFEMEFVGGRPESITAAERQETTYNYFLGNDPNHWGRGATGYHEVLYSGVYKGIDLRVYSTGEHLKYDWIVQPCEDPNQISVRYNGLEDLDLVNEELIVCSRVGSIREGRPVAYQEIGGLRRNVQCEFRLEDGRVGFNFPDGFDANYELVIDPILIFSSYSGSKADNWGNTATPDGHGNLYSGGMVRDNLGIVGFPVTPGAFQIVHHGGNWDVGILKYDSIGATVIYATYLGGSGAETPQSLVVNNHDELLILGASSSNNFPGTLGGTFRGGQPVEPLQGIEYDAGTDIFIARLSSDGKTLLSSTYLGGTQNDAINFVSGSMTVSGKVESPLARNYGDQLRGDITVDEDDNVFIATNTRSSDFPVINTDPLAQFHGGTHDAVIAKLKPDLSGILWSRLIGGSLTDVAYSVKVTAAGRIYAAGGTSSNNLAGMNGLIKVAPGTADGWIVEVSSDGTQLVNGTYLGTSAYDQAYFIDIATQGDVLAYGQTKGSYPIKAFGDFVYSNPGSGQFIHRLNANLSTTVFSTVFGSSRGGPDISPTAFLVNDCNNIYVAGWGGRINDPNYFIGLGPPADYYVGGDTRNMPITVDAYQKATVAGNDFYLMVLTGYAQEMVYATYLGGTTSLTHVDGGTSRFDKRGVVYHAVCASCGFLADFPAVNVPLERATNGSGRCNNAAFKFDLSSLKARIQTNKVDLKSPGFNSVCYPNAIVFENKSVGGSTFQWDLGDGTKRETPSTDTIRHHYKKAGIYIIKLKIIDHSTCIGEDSTIAVINVSKPNLSAGLDKAICHGTSTRLSASGGVKYEWRAAHTPFVSTEASPLVTPEDSDDYYVTITDGFGCIGKDTMNVRVVPGIDLKFEYEQVYDCSSRPYVRVVNLTELKEDEQAFIDFGDGTVSTSGDDIHTYKKDGIYQLTLIGQKEFCTFAEAIELPFVDVSIPNVITPDESIGQNDSFRLVDPASARGDLVISLIIYDRWGKLVYRNADYRDDWTASNVEGGVFYYEVNISDKATCKGWLQVIK